MSDDIKKIIDSLDKAQDNFGKSKDKLSDWLDEVGYQMEVTKGQKNLWAELDKQGSVPSPITVSGYNMAQSLVQNSEKVAMYIDDSQIDKAIFTAVSASEVSAGTVVSGASLAYPPNQLPQAYYQLDSVLSQRTNQTDISQRLRLIDPSLADEYDNAWLGLHSAPKDETRSPMFLIREVVTRLYHHYAPDSKVRPQFNLGQGEKITRKHRLDYIASLIDPWQRQTLLNEEHSLLDIYGVLSKAHKHGSLDTTKTRGFLYQANGLIKLLLELL
jgi:hypothetical protein